MMNCIAMAYAAVSPSSGPLMVSDLGLLLRPRTEALHLVLAQIACLSFAVKVPLTGIGPKILSIICRQSRQASLGRQCQASPDIFGNTRSRA